MGLHADLRVAGHPPLLCAADVAPDGQHSVTTRGVAAGTPGVAYVQGWFPELLRLMGGEARK